MNSNLIGDLSKCEFCFAFFVDPSKEANHNRKCEFRLSRTFAASDGKVKFACTVCRDVFLTEAQLKCHETLHKYPGGYVCSVCGETFRNDAACDRHQKTVHQLFKCLCCEGDETISTESEFVAHLQTKHNGSGRYAMCTLCGAHFEQKSYLRLHAETKCGQSGTWNCSDCGVELGSEIELGEHRRTSHALDLIDSDCIKVEENPLLVPKIEVSSIDYLTNGMEDGNDDSESQMMEFEVIIDDGNDSEDGNAGAPIECKEEPIDNDSDYDPFNGMRDGSECSDVDEDRELDESDFVDLSERWTHMTDNTFECNVCQMKFDILDETEAHVILHGPSGDRVHQCPCCVRYYSTVDKMKRHLAKEHRDPPCESDGSESATSSNELSDRRKHKCPYCNWTYFTVERRDIHVKLHGPNGELVHKCSCCRLFFATHKEMLKHRFNTHKETVCNTCRPRLTFKSASVLAVHMKKKHPKKGVVHKCRICLIDFRSAKELAEHGWEQHAPTTCTDCGKIFVKLVDIRRHTSKQVCKQFGPHAVDDEDIEGYDECSMDSTTQNGDRASNGGERNDGNAGSDSADSEDAETIGMDNRQKMKLMKRKLKDWNERGIRTTTAKCTICNIKYGYVWHFEKHIKIHGSDGQWSVRCKYCPERLITADDLKRHIAEVHNHQCHLCDRKYIHKTGLRIHLVSAHERYKCEKCGMTFNRKVTLSKHVRTDCGTIPQHKCALCPEAFHTAVELREHVMDHEKESCKMCSTCGKTFDKISSLKLHVAQAHRRSFKCRYCGNLFKARIHLLKHLAEHTGIAPFKCLYCNEEFSWMRKLEDHRSANPTTCNTIPLTDDCIIDIDADDADARFNLTVNPYEFPCKYCGAIFKTVESRRLHAAHCPSNPNRNTAKLEHRCEECKLNFPRRKERIEHLRNVHKELGCNFCDKKFKLESFLLKHVSVHGPDGKLLFKCVCCQLHFASIEERTKHERTDHLDKLKCKICGKVKNDPHSLNFHVKYAHQSQTDQMCMKCGKLFQNSILLKRHEDNDCGKNEIYKCEHCGKHLGSPYSLRSHVENMHENQEKKFVCSFCGKAFFSKGALQSHSRNHTGERPYKCDHCDKSFASRTSARNHESTHTGIKPYMCQCGDRFSCISNLQSHRKARKTTCGLLPLISKRLPDTRIVDTPLKKSGEENPKSTKRV